jgi:histidyl-tRNA synthetase
MSRQIDDIVFPLDEVLEGPASNIASSLRKKGRAVDLVEDKRLKWYAVFLFLFVGRKWYAV